MYLPAATKMSHFLQEEAKYWCLMCLPCVV